MNPKFILLGSVVLALVAWLLDAKNSDQKGNPFQTYISALGRNAKAIGVVALFAALAVFAGWYFSKGYPGALPAGIGLLIGSLIATKVDTYSRAFPSQAYSIVPVALAMVGGCLTWILGNSSYEIRLGLIVGAACGAAILSLGSVGDRGNGGWQFAAASAIVNSGLILGAQRGDDRSAMGFALLGLALVLILCARPLIGNIKPLHFGIALGFCFVIAAWGICGKYVELPMAPLVALIGVVCALLTYWLIDEGDEKSTTNVALTSLIWVSAATVAFGQARGYGMAILTLAGFGVFVALGARRAMLFLGVPTGLLIYRIFMEQYAGSTRTLEVSQHYAVIGAIFGALIPIALWEFGGRVRAQDLWIKSPLLGLFAIGVTAMGLISSLFLVDVHGGVGLLIGLSLAPILMAWREKSNESLLGICAALGAGMVLLFGFVAPKLGIERDVKVKLVIGLAVGVLALIFATQLLLANNKKKETS